MAKWEFCPHEITEARIDFIVAAERAARAQIQAERMAAHMAELLEMVQSLRSALDDLGAQLADLQRNMARIEARRADRRAGKPLPPWISLVAV